MARVKLVQRRTPSTSRRLVEDGLKPVRGEADSNAGLAHPSPVSVVPGAMYGYCPRCSAPVIRRDKPVGDKWGKDHCQTGHTFPSLEALARPLVAAPVNKVKLIPKRRKNK